MDKQIITIEFLYRKHKGVLGMAWIAGTRGPNKIKINQIVEFSVSEACDLIMKYLIEKDPARPKLSLRMSSLLMNGVLKLYQQQVNNTQEQMNAFFIKATRISSPDSYFLMFSSPSSPSRVLKKRKTKKLPQLLPALEFPEFEIEDVENGDSVSPLRARIAEITMQEDITEVPDVEEFGTAFGSPLRQVEEKSLHELFAGITFNPDPPQQSTSSSNVGPVFIIEHAQIIREDVPDVPRQMEVEDVLITDADVNRRSDTDMDSEEMKNMIQMQYRISQSSGKTRHPENMLTVTRQSKKYINRCNITDCFNCDNAYVEDLRPRITVILDQKFDANCFFPREMFTSPGFLMENETLIMRGQVSPPPLLSPQFEDTTLSLSPKRTAYESDRELEESKRFRMEQSPIEPPIEEHLPEIQPIEEPRIELSLDINAGITDKLRYEKIMNIVNTWDPESGIIGLEDVVEEPLTKLNVARAFGDILVLCKNGYLKLFSEKNSTLLKSIQKGSKLM